MENSLLNTICTMGDSFGNFSNNDLIFMAEQIITDPRWMPGMDAVADFRYVTSYGIRLNDLFLARNIHSQFECMAGKGRIAVILGDKTSLLLSHAYKIIASMYMKIKLRPFNDYDAGVEWICGEPDYLSVKDQGEGLSQPFKYH
jgi:hypothetical protein